MKKILFAGESWSSHTTHVKGYDPFFTATYATGETWLKAALEAGGYEVTFMPNHEAAGAFPFTMAELEQYDCVILSDIGSNTLLIPEATMTKSQRMPNRCDLIREYVLAGGALLMVGGYLTFTGVDAKGRWGVTPVADVLPVTLLDVDDRREHCEGVVPVVEKEHPALAGVKGEWPFFLGYNKLLAKPGAEVPVTVCGDPMVALMHAGKGRTAAFASDCAPHWGPPEFVEWQYYNALWQGIVGWLVGG